jgi:uncharacterized LabA/DUF88 family protein
MKIEELKLQSLGIEKSKFGEIYSFVDFGNVNYWYEQDRYVEIGKLLPEDEKLVVDIAKLATFTKMFSKNSRFYFGIDDRKIKSITILKSARENFDKAVTKPIQYVKHYLSKSELKNASRAVIRDSRGQYIEIPKCNFDVEICVDASRFLSKYDTFCLFSSDADFAYLLEYLKRQKKKVILISSGYVRSSLKEKADLNINSQLIKSLITIKKRKPRFLGRG